MRILRRSPLNLLDSEASREALKTSDFGCHTADFHAGRSLRGFDRTPGVHDALTGIAALARTERADVVLVSGDLFDTANPSAEAERAVFDFFLRLRDQGIPSVVIAGNHDSAVRLASVTGLLGWVWLRAAWRPTRSSHPEC